MDKLTIQTIYVPVDQPRNNAFQGLERIHKGGIGYMDKQDNRIVFTPQELSDLFAEYQLSSIHNVSQFLKSKGIEI